MKKHLSSNTNFRVTKPTKVRTLNWTNDRNCINSLPFFGCKLQSVETDRSFLFSRGDGKMRLLWKKATTFTRLRLSLLQSPARWLQIVSCLRFMQIGWITPSFTLTKDRFVKLPTVGTAASVDRYLPPAPGGHASALDKWDGRFMWVPQAIHPASQSSPWDRLWASDEMGWARQEANILHRLPYPCPFASSASSRVYLGLLSPHPSCHSIWNRGQLVANLLSPCGCD